MCDSREENSKMSKVLEYLMKDDVKIVFKVDTVSSTIATLFSSFVSIANCFKKLILSFLSLTNLMFSTSIPYSLTTKSLLFCSSYGADTEQAYMLFSPLLSINRFNCGIALILSYGLFSITNFSQFSSLQPLCLNSPNSNGASTPSTSNTI